MVDWITCFKTKPLFLNWRLLLIITLNILTHASDASVQSDDLHNVVSDVSAASYSSNSSNQNWTTENDASAINFIYDKEFVHGDMITRIKRDANNEFLDNVAVVSHIVSGITLQHSLINNGTLVEIFVGELLKFGNFSISDVVGFNISKIETYIDSIKGVRGSFNTYSLKFEETALSYDEVRNESESIRDFLNSSKSDRYFGDIEIAMKMDMVKLDTLKTSIDHLISEFKALKIDLSETTALRDTIQKFDDLKALVGSLKPLESLRNGTEIFTDFVKILKLASDRENLQSVTIKRAELDTFHSHMNLIQQMMRENNSINNEISKLKSFSANFASETTKSSFGFQYGLDDVKKLMEDVKHPWLVNMTGDLSYRLYRLSDGFRPLFVLTKQMIRLKEKLKKLSSVDTFPSLTHFDQIQKKLLSPSSLKLIDVVEKYKACTGFPISQNFKEKISNISRDAKIVERGITSLIVAVKTTSKIDLKSMFHNVEKNNRSIIVHQELALLKTLYASVDRMRLSEALASLQNSRQIISAFRQNATGELAYHACIHKLKTGSEQLVQLIQAIQKIRDVDEKMISNAENGVSIISEVIEELSGIRKRFKNMKKGKWQEFLNMMRDSEAYSENIFQTLKYLREANSLIELRASISGLESIGSSVEMETREIGKLDDGKRIMKQWGDHQKDMDQLNDAIREIKLFYDFLNISKATTIAEYGVPILGMLHFPDVGMNSREKSEAIGELLQGVILDPKTRFELETNQKIFDELALLDLQFSSHRHDFNATPEAFREFGVFLKLFLEIEEVSYTIIIFSCAVALVVLAIAMFVYVKFYYLPNRIPKIHARVMRWIKREFPKNAKIALKIHEDIMRMIEAPIEHDQLFSYAKLDPGKHRNPHIFCNPENRVLIYPKDPRDSRVHGNCIRTRKKEFVATQGPIGDELMGGFQYKNEKGELVLVDYVDTREDFLTMLVERKVEKTVMLCDFVENGIPQCGVYFIKELGGVIVIGRFTVTTMTVDSILNGNGSKRVLKITEKGKPEVLLDHYQYLAWLDQDIPNGHEDMYRLMNMKPIVVHCSAGVGRTTAFIALHYLTAEVALCETTSFTEFAIDLNMKRWRALQTVHQSYWVQAGVVYKTLRDRKLRMKYYKKYMKRFEEMKKWEVEREELARKERASHVAIQMPDETE
ncbi:hypothetical protein GCK72_015161 [Caenorhabditis remanei]|uniref:Tyrosine-protein phosphatase domain-containing protein n=1 Tax=Caenorhabditis remanei TaxID=31234 RepID=A0A6A5GVR8_CAERE|nr:hypothetical protein GCK72_015161 [Caenorhabditis remanei]KAF1758701.1 hypothetical protein GCK72_015161 [Caenorhabditis remanei]